MALLFVAGMHAGFTNWTLRSRLMALALLTATAATGSAVFEFYDVYYFTAGIIRRMVPALIFCTTGFYYGRLLAARRKRRSPYFMRLPAVVCNNLGNPHTCRHIDQSLGTVLSLTLSFDSTRL